MLVGLLVEPRDDVRVILAVKPEVILFAVFLMVFGCVFRMIFAHDYLPRYAISSAAAIRIIANMVSSIRLLRFLVFVDYEHDFLRVALRQ